MKVAYVGDETRTRMDNMHDWNAAHERLELLLPHGLDEVTWEVLRHHSLSFIADELLWRVEAIARQVPAQGPIFLESLARVDRQHSGTCVLCAEQPGSGIGQRCARCVAALNLVLGFPLLLDDAGMIDAGEMGAPEQHDEPVASNLFEV